MGSVIDGRRGDPTIIGASRPERYEETNDESKGAAALGSEDIVPTSDNDTFG